jgi:hypothetical protein
MSCQRLVILPVEGLGTKLNLKLPKNISRIELERFFTLHIQDITMLETASPTHFPFLHLPIDLQLHTLELCDLSTLFNLVASSKAILNLYNANSSSIIKHVLSGWPLQVQRLILTVLTMRSTPEDSIPLGSLDDYLQTHLENKSAVTQVPQDDSKRTNLRLLHTLSAEIDIFVPLCFQMTFEKFPQYYDVSAISSVERHRMVRALWRLTLVLLLDMHVKGHPYKADGTGSWFTFFGNHLAIWEKEEMLSMALFLCRLSAYVSKTHPTSWPSHTLLNIVFDESSGPRSEISFFQGLWNHLVLLCKNKDPPTDIANPDAATIWPDSQEASQPTSVSKDLCPRSWRQAQHGFNVGDLDPAIVDELNLIRNASWVIWDDSRLAQMFAPDVPTQQRILQGSSGNTRCGVVFRGPLEVSYQQETPLHVVGTVMRLWYPSGVPPTDDTEIHTT